ncbi:MAG: hypothetical protein J6B28_04620 [Eubacterium sp.]|nr:hypothetical protein [Eubacterium sp.]
MKENKKKKNVNGLHYIWYVCIIVGILVICGVAIFALPKRAYSPTENRYLTTEVPLSVQEMLSGEVQRNLTELSADQFPLRDSWVKLATIGQYLMYHREINGVYLGKENYLFEKTVASDLSMENYRTNIGYVTAMAAQSPADISVMLIPTPATILQEYLPKRAVVYDPLPYEEQGMLLCEMDSVRWVQTREALERAHRDSLEPLYFCTDHHWTTNGAYIGASVYLDTQHRTIKEKQAYEIACVSEDFYGTLHSKVAGLPGKKPDTLEVPMALPQDLVIETNGAPADALGANGEKQMPELDGIYDRSKLDGKDKYAVYFGGNYGMLTVRNPQMKDGGKLLLIKDSYANSMVPYLLESYAQITMIDLRYYNESVPELATQDWDEILVCYEMSNFVRDRNLFKCIRN